MGNQATVIILTDHLDLIRADPEFGRNLVSAILKVNYKGPEDIYAHTEHCTAGVGSVIECHHCDQAVAIVATNAFATVLGNVGSSDRILPIDRKEDALRDLAEQLGFTLHKKREKRKVSLD